MVNVDPALFSPESISAEQREFNAGLEESLRGVPPSQSRPAAVTRAERDAGGGVLRIPRGG